MLFPQEDMAPKALSLTQPWAYAVAQGLKKVENRKWKPSHKFFANGPVRIAIHASMTFDEGGAAFLKKQGVVVPPEKIVHGAVLGLCRVVRVVTQSTDPMFFGPYGWELDSFQPLPTPIPCKGALSLWSMPDEVWQQLKSALKL